MLPVLVLVCAFKRLCGLPAELRTEGASNCRRKLPATDATIRGYLLITRKLFSNTSETNYAKPFYGQGWKKFGGHKNSRSLPDSLAGIPANCGAIISK
jgi:hypothetical protein